MWDILYVEVYSENELICIHNRKFTVCGYSTKEEHMPESHKAWIRTKNLNAATYLDMSKRIGPSTEWVIQTMLTKSQFPQQAYGKCQAVMALAKKYGEKRVEHASELMKTETSIASLKVLTNILKKNRDLISNETIKPVHNEDVRGASYYQDMNNNKDENDEY